MKTTGQIRTDLARRLDQTWQHVLCGDPTGWPLRLPLGKPTRADMDTRFPAVQRWAGDWRAWAAERGLELAWAGRHTAGIPQQVPTHLTVPDVDTAAGLLGAPWPTRLARGRARHAVLCTRFPHAVSPERLRALDPLSDTDFDLLCTAGAWFAVHDATGLTPRQVPIEGLHGKWLNRYRALVTALAGKDTLGLVKRPTRVHFTYLDPDHRAAGGRWHDSLMLGDSNRPAYAPQTVVICENKDTVLFFPEVPGGITVEGGGTAASGLLPQVPWLAAAPRIFYWGDMDAAGYEILDRLRGNGLAVTAILMDLRAYETYERFGAWTDEKGEPVPCAPRKPVPHLRDAEREVYERLTDPTWPRVRRIEQERIPLEIARALL